MNALPTYEEDKQTATYNCKGRKVTHRHLSLMIAESSRSRANQESYSIYLVPRYRMWLLCHGTEQYSVHSRELNGYFSFLNIRLLGLEISLADTVSFK